MKKEDNFSDIFSLPGRDLEDRKEKIIERSSKMKFDEEFHTRGRAGWSIDLFLELDKFITGLRTGVRKEYLETYIKYSYNGLLFCYIMLRKKEVIRLWVKVDYNKLGAVPLFVRDYEKTSRRVGVMITFDDQRDFLQNKEAMLNVVFSIVEKALQEVASRKKRRKTPLTERIKEVDQIEKKLIEPVERKAIEPIEPVIKLIKSAEINILTGENGYLSVNFKIHKSQKEFLNRILQETILK